MEVRFVDRATAKRLIASNYFVENACDLISVSDSARERKEIRNLWLDRKCEVNAALFLDFRDIDDNSSGFTEAKARKIIDFVAESHKKKKSVIVHCFAGISRSGAIAKYVNEYYALEDEYLNNYVGHNRWVYYTLLEYSGQETLRSFYTNLENERGKDE